MSPDGSDNPTSPTNRITNGRKLHLPKDFPLNSAVTKGKSKLSFSAYDIQTVFPYHIVVDKDFVIIQVGSKLQEYLKGVKLLDKSIDQVFSLRSPRDCEWDWVDITIHGDSSFELQLLDDVEIDPLHKDRDTTPEQRKLLGLKGGLYITDPDFDPTAYQYAAFFLVNPRFRNLTEMIQQQVTLTDIPRFGFQRDFAFLGEHLRCETKLAHKMDALSKELNKELGDALQGQEADRLAAKAREDALAGLPVHQAIIDGRPEDEVLRAIDEFPLTVLTPDYDGKSAFDWSLEKDAYDQVVLRIVKDHLPVDPVSKAFVSPDLHGYCWSKIVQSAKYASIVEGICEEFVHIAKELSLAKDAEDRPALNISCPACQKIIRESLYFLKRYEIASLDIPLHKSSTCTLYIAVDHHNGGQSVALKFMAVKVSSMKHISIGSSQSLIYRCCHVIGAIREGALQSSRRRIRRRICDQRYKILRQVHRRVVRPGDPAQRLGEVQVVHRDARRRSQPAEYHISRAHCRT